MQLALVFLGAILGLTYGQYYQGFVFSSVICLFAGLTLIMPTLFKVKFSDIKLVYEHRVLLLKGLFINYVVLPLIAIGLGLLTDNFGLAAGLFLLSVLSGGGMVMQWIKKSQSDISVGFVLLFINLVFVSLSLLMLHKFGEYFAPYFGDEYEDAISIESFAQGVIELLIIIPFILSRIIIFIKPVENFIVKMQPYISKISLFIILFYLFGLQNSQLLFELYDFEPELFPISIVAVLAFYFFVFLVGRFAYDFNSAVERAAFWHTITRYITLALVISTFTINTFGVSMILPIMVAYVVQIPIAIMLSKSKFLLGDKVVNNGV